ncbi:MAG: type II toxin-antitoxin system VapC family toxin, partial [Gemmataceae bacterium]
MTVLDTDTLTHLIAEHPRVVERYRREIDEVVITIINRIEVLEGRFATLRKAANGVELQRGQQRLDQAERDLSAFRVLP